MKIHLFAFFISIFPTTTTTVKTSVVTPKQMTRVHRPQPGNTRGVHCTHAHVQHLNRTGQLDEDVGDVI